ncbi:hypothetical protein ACVFYJ_15380, partial [Klebsiella michiganensis]
AAGCFRVVNLTRLRTFAATGKNRHGPVQMSGTEATLFVGFSAKNVAGEHQRYWTARRFVAGYSRAKGLKR